MNSKNQSTLMKVVSVIIFLLVIVLVVGLVLKYTSVGEQLKDLANTEFRVEYDGKGYDGEDNVITLPTNGQAKFKVKGVDSYKVKITPNVTDETDFTYEIGDSVYAFSHADLAKVFISDDSIANGYFTIDCSQDLTIEGVLSKLHNSAEVSLNGKVDYPYRLTFTNGDKVVSFVFVVEIKVDLSDSNLVY